MSNFVDKIKNSDWYKNQDQRYKLRLEKEKEARTTCPKCHSRDIQIAGKDKDGFSVGKAAGGALLTGGIGLLAGFAGKDKGITFYCSDCGNIFNMRKK